MLFGLFLLLVAVLIIFLVIKSNVLAGDNSPGPTLFEVIFANLNKDFQDRFHETLCKWADKYGKLYTIGFLQRRTIVINDLDLMRRMMADDTFTGRPSVSILSDMYDDGVQHGLVISNPPHWEELRSFTQKKLRILGFPRTGIEPLVMEELEEYLDTLRTAAKEKRTLSNWRIELTIPVVNSFWRICTGEKLPHDIYWLGEVIMQTTGLVNDILTKHGGTLFIFSWFKKVFPDVSGYNMVRSPFLALSAFCSKRIDDHRNTKREKPDLIDEYFKQITETTNPSSAFYGEMGEKHLCGVLADVLVAGGDALSASTQWGLLYLALHQEVQQRLLEEVVKEAKGGKCTLDMRENMNYIEAVIAETLRCSSFFAVGFGSCPIRDTEIDGIKLYKGEQILYNMNYIHNDKAVFGDPENFRPERHLSPEGLFIRHPRVIPFFFGRRQCFGEVMARDTMFLFLTNIIRVFRLELTEKSRREGINMEADKGIFRFPKRFELSLHLRNEEI